MFSFRDLKVRQKELEKVNLTIRDVIKNEYNIDINDTSHEELLRAIDIPERGDILKGFYIEALYHLENITSIMCLYTNSIYLKCYQNNLRGKKEVYDDLKVISRRISDLTCTLLNINIMSDGKYFSFEEYNKLILPAINDILFIAYCIERNDKKNYIKLPVDLYTTDDFFDTENLVFKLDFSKVKIDFSEAEKSLKKSYSNYEVSIGVNLKKLSQDLLDKIEFKRVLNLTKTTNVFLNKFINKSLLNNLIRTLAVSFSLNLTTLSTKNGEIIEKHNTISSNFSILDKLTNGAFKSSINISGSLVKNQSPIISKIMLGLNALALGLTLLEAGMAAKSAYKASLEGNSIKYIYGIKVRCLENVSCHKLYRKLKDK